MIRTVVLILLVFAGVFLLSSWGNNRAAYRLLAAGHELFVPEQDEDERGRKAASPRRPGVKMDRRRVTPLTKKKIGEKYNWRCGCGCGHKLSFDYHVDHIIPLWKGGTNAEDNLQPLNPRCHALNTSLENQA